jgi:hypothetical protein
VNHTLARCRSCGAEIEWAVSPTGKRIPIDATAVPIEKKPIGAAAYAVDRRSSLAPKLTKLPADHTAGAVYVSHFSTCPDSATWSKKGKP